jgi:hypothetical protein
VIFSVSNGKKSSTKVGVNLQVQEICSGGMFRQYVQAVCSEGMFRRHVQVICSGDMFR